MRKQLAKSTNRSVHFSEMFVGLNASCEHIMAVSQVYVYDVYDDVPWVPYWGSRVKSKGSWCSHVFLS